MVSIRADGFVVIKFARTLFAAIALFGMGTLQAPAKAAELWMVEEDGCMWCRQWHAEIGPIYPKTAEGRRAPLRLLDIHGLFPADVELTKRTHYTPTFILVDQGVEVGRIEGYPGEAFFWGMLGQLIDRLPNHGEAS